VDHLGRLMFGVAQSVAAEPVERKLEKGLKVRLHPATMRVTAERGVAEGVITHAEAEVLHRAAKAMRDAVWVDEFGDAGRIKV
jgi:hypothetical protein